MGFAPQPQAPTSNWASQLYGSYQGATDQAQKDSMIRAMQGNDQGAAFNQAMKDIGYSYQAGQNGAPGTYNAPAPQAPQAPQGKGGGGPGGASSGGMGQWAYPPNQGMGALMQNMGAFTQAQGMPIAMTSWRPGLGYGAQPGYFPRQTQQAPKG